MDQTNQTKSLLEAVSFSARVHKNQFRKDKNTPYSAHPFRVCLILRHIFGVTNMIALESALLHDSIEDTETDYDDVCEQFGKDVADCVAALTKDMRLPEEEREVQYIKTLTQSNECVRWCKLADIYDNLLDSTSLSSEKTNQTIKRVKGYLDAIAINCPPSVQPAFRIVIDLWNKLGGM